MTSFLGRIMPLAITLRGGKRRYRSEALTLAKVERERRHPRSHVPPRSLARTVDVRRRTVDGWTVYDLIPRAGEAPRRALYLHGGSNVYEIAPQHFTLAAELAVRAGAIVTVPIYPLAPAGTADLVIAGTTALARALVDEVGADGVTVLGDSAGGGMALATAMQLRDAAVPAPRVILISPSLDLSFGDPAVVALAASDPWLDVPGARAAAWLYRGALPVDDPRVSSIHGDLAGVGPIALFCGTRDMLLADARRLVALAEDDDDAHALEYHEVEGMIHVYPLLPIPEARAARTLMVEFMTR